MHKYAYKAVGAEEASCPNSWTCADSADLFLARQASGLESEWKARVGLDKADAKKEKEKAAKLKEAKKAKAEKVKMRALKANEAKLAKQSVALAKATARLEKEKALVCAQESDVSVFRPGRRARSSSPAPGTPRAPQP